MPTSRPGWVCRSRQSAGSSAGGWSRPEICCEDARPDPGTMGRMGLFSKSRPDAAEVDALATKLGRRPRALAWGSGPDTYVLGLPEGLGVRRGAEWDVIGWHEIESGGWKADAQELAWRLDDDTEGAVALDEPGSVPELFKERVEASIVIEQYIDVPGGRVVIAGRRDLADPTSAIVWHAMPVGGARLDNPAVRQRVLDATARLRADYEI